MPNAVLPLILALAVLVLILYRQLQPRPVNAETGGRRPLLFGLVGVVLAGQYLLQHSITALGIVGLLASLVIASALAYWRGHTVHLWRQDGAWWRRGTALTLVLWLCSIGSHLGIDALIGNLDPSEGLGRGLGNATLLLYLAISLGLQHLVVTQRVRRLDLATSAGAAG